MMRTAVAILILMLAATFAAATTLTIKDVGSGQIVRGFNATDDCTATISKIPASTSGGTTTTATVKDCTVLTTTSGTTLYKSQIAVSQPLQYGTYSLSNPSSAATFSLNAATGLCTRVASGTGTVALVANQGKRILAIDVTDTVGPTITQFGTFVTGSLGSYSCNGVLSAIGMLIPQSSGGTITGASGSGIITGTLTQSIYSTANDSTLAYARNANNFLAAGSIDMTCINEGGATGATLIANGTHSCVFECASHAPVSFIRCVDASGNPHSATIVSQGDIGNDIHLDFCQPTMPSGITTALLLPSTYNSAGGHGYAPGLGFGAPAPGYAVLGVRTSQFQVMTTVDITALSSTGLTYAPVPSGNAHSWWTETVAGDSGGGIFLPISGRLVELGHMHGYSDGPSLADNAAAITTWINAAAAAASDGSPPAIGTVSLAAFTAYAKASPEIERFDPFKSRRWFEPMAALASRGGLLRKAA